MELKRPFGVTELLSERNARATFDRCNELRRQPEFSTQGLLRQAGVALVGTTDDPADSLEHHQALAKDDGDTRVVPTWRPDSALAVEHPASFNAWIERLEAPVRMLIGNLAQLFHPLQLPPAYFRDARLPMPAHRLERL